MNLRALEHNKKEILEGNYTYICTRNKVCERAICSHIKLHSKQKDCNQSACVFAEGKDAHCEPV